jgi:hypothetical protein
MVAAIGTGNMINTLFIISISVSMNASLETLVSQAAGSGNLYNCAVYLN